MKKRYLIENRITSEEIKKTRKILKLTQQEFADLLGCSKPTVERWESNKDEVQGPIALLVQMIKQHPEWLEYYEEPKKEMPLRMIYMYKNNACTLIDVDISKQIIQIKNYTDEIQFRAFGKNTEPRYKDFEEFLESRCFPKTRDSLSIILKDLDLPFYDPLMIIEKTQGKMAEDDFWIKLEK